VMSSRKIGEVTPKLPSTLLLLKTVIRVLSWMGIFVQKNGNATRNLHSVGGFAHGSSYRRRFQIRQECRQQAYGRQH
jgi:hypothetical protein